MIILRALLRLFLELPTLHLVSPGSLAEHVRWHGHRGMLLEKLPSVLLMIFDEVNGAGSMSTAVGMAIAFSSG